MMGSVLLRFLSRNDLIVSKMGREVVISFGWFVIVAMPVCFAVFLAKYWPGREELRLIG